MFEPFGSTTVEFFLHQDSLSSYLDAPQEAWGRQGVERAETFPKRADLLQGLSSLFSQSSDTTLLLVSSDTLLHVSLDTSPKQSKTGHTNILAVSLLPADWTPASFEQEEALSLTII